MPAIQVSAEFFERVKIAAKKGHRSVPKQLEYWEEMAEAADKSMSAAQKVEQFEQIIKKYDETFKILAK